jgi:hypothetical protein
VKKQDIETLKDAHRLLEGYVEEDETHNGAGAEESRETLDALGEVIRELEQE